MRCFASKMPTFASKMRSFASKMRSLASKMRTFASKMWTSDSKMQNVASKMRKLFESNSKFCLIYSILHPLTPFSPQNLREQSLKLPKSLITLTNYQKMRPQTTISSCHSLFLSCHKLLAIFIIFKWCIIIHRLFFSRLLPQEMKIMLLLPFLNCSTTYFHQNRKLIDGWSCLASFKLLDMIKKIQWLFFVCSSWSGLTHHWANALRL